MLGIIGYFQIQELEKVTERSPKTLYTLVPMKEFYHRSKNLLRINEMINYFKIHGTKNYILVKSTHIGIWMVNETME